LSPEEKSEFEDIKAKIEGLLKGEVIGVPKQRKILAALQKRKELIK